MITDEMLAQAADAYVQIMVENIPDLPEYRHSFSARFERKIRRIIRRGSHPVLYRTMRAAGYAVAALVLSFLTLMAVNPSARAAVMDWIREMYGTYSHNYYNQDSDIELQNIHCELNYIPPDYVVFFNSETISNVTYTFVNASGEMIIISYSKQPQSIEYFYETKEYSISVVPIHKQYGEYIEVANKEIAPILQWKTTEYDLLFSISGYLEKNEMIKIAENIKINLK